MRPHSVRMETLRAMSDADVSTVSVRAASRVHTSTITNASTISARRPPPAGSVMASLDQYIAEFEKENGAVGKSVTHKTWTGRSASGAAASSVSHSRDVSSVALTSAATAPQPSQRRRPLTPKRDGQGPSTSAGKVLFKAASPAAPGDAGTRRSRSPAARSRWVTTPVLARARTVWLQAWKLVLRTPPRGSPTAGSSRWLFPVSTVCRRVRSANQRHSTVMQVQQLPWPALRRRPPQRRH